jgi:hypothetical protein
MPQRLSNVRPNAKVSLHHKHSTNKPELAVLVTSIFARWAWIEHQISVILLFILGAEAKPAFAMFDILNTQRLQMSAIQAAAKVALPIDQFEVFTAAMLVTDIVQKDRNRLAHWIWGTCPELPDRLLLADPDHLREKEFLRADVTARRPVGGLDPSEFDRLFEVNPAEVFVYSKTDLERIERDLAQAVGMIAYLRLYLNPPFTEEAAARLKLLDLPNFCCTRSQALDGLSKLHLFQEALARAKSTQNTPEANGE